MTTEPTNPMIALSEAKQDELQSDTNLYRPEKGGAKLFGISYVEYLRDRIEKLKAENENLRQTIESLQSKSGERENKD